MLQFNPYLRPSVEQCIASPYFDTVRTFSVVKPADQIVKLDIEDRNLSLEELRAEFCKIVNFYEKSSS